MRRASRALGAPAEIAARLRSRQGEIERAALTRVVAVSEPPPHGGPEYAEGLRGAVVAAIAYTIAGIERGGAPMPAPLLVQARLAASAGVGLDTVLRRCLAGHSLLSDFLVEEAGREPPLGPADLKRSLRRLAAGLDLLVVAVSGAYAEEEEARKRQSTEHRRADLIERLLRGEPLDASGLGYELDAHHLGLLASGPDAQKATAALARSLDARPLVLSRDADMLWAWLGRHDPIEAEDARRLVEATWPSRLTLALGEPGEGVAGWRLTHQQARVAYPIALRGPRAPVRYADVALLAAIMQDDLFATSLRRIYLEPLARERDGGITLRKALRAYFAAECNVSSAAVALGVNRNTLAGRLRAVERHLGRRVGSCAAELEAALRLGAAETDPAEDAGGPYAEHSAEFPAPS